VADTSTALKKSQLTRGKAILIGALMLVLGGVLYWQFGGGDGKGAGNEVIAYTPRRPVPAATAAAVPEAGTKSSTAVKPRQADNKSLAVTTAVVDESRWKSPPLTEVVGYDPFALPAAFPKTAVADPTQPSHENLVASAAIEDRKKLIDAVAQLQMQLEQIKQRGVQVIVKERDQYVAMIGDQTVYVGYDLGNGFTVTGIDQNGVRVERKATQ
jgi:hypothetical protein